jgi:type III secretory pathway component EscR
MDAYQRTLASMTLQVSMPVSAPVSLKITQSAQNNEEKLLTLAMMSQWLE